MENTDIITFNRVLRCADLCSAAYVDNDPRFIDIEELRFGVMHFENEATYLIYRGTCNLRGWLDDFTVVPHRTMMGYLAHMGFIHAVEKVWEGVCAALDGKPGPWIITGHSLGAAMALLTAEKLQQPVVTFGCPRVYSHLNETYPSIDHLRIAVDDDPVTMVPNPLLWYHLNRRYLELPSDGELAIDVEDHDIDYYHRLLLERGRL
jgi:hypothetical protein